tara:strand:- start:1819 stop:2343 length:525 start_codon:yes stop_codon:yes gene_type:complete
MLHSLLILLTVLFSNITLETERTIEEIIRSHFQELIKVECKYRQEKKISFINDPLISTGIFIYNKNEDIIWKQEYPFQETYIIKEKSENKDDEYINQFIISILNGAILDNKKLKTNYSEDKNKYFLILTPKKGVMKKKIKAITLTFNKQNISLNKLDIESQNNDITKINFYDKK